MDIIEDSSIRAEALNIKNSYIVQAPAGSGKTELLIQRYLALLANVKVPESIIAITFTRKAANEMRERVVDALVQAQTGDNLNEINSITYQLAQKALNQNNKQQWNLEANINRLRIQTIDKLSASIVSSAPILSQFGSKPNVTEYPYSYYQQAAKNLLVRLEDPHPWGEELVKILLHLDNQQEQIATLFSQLLARRDQWLPHIIKAKNQQDLRQQLEKSLQNTIIDQLENVLNLFPFNLRQECIKLAYFASVYRQDKNLAFEQFPQATLEDYSKWKALSNWLLTKKGEWRKKVDTAIDFSKNKLEKIAMQSFLSQLQVHAELANALYQVQQLPPSVYSDEQWEIIKALINVLPVLVAELKLLFQQDGVVDFIEIAANASLALGEPEQPSLLTLNLDYQIQHLLVDEFQDTSITQYQLLEKLTAGWQQDDGRTLFLVGDPMQSIYRFREAEIGLFLRAKQQGIGAIKLNSLRLTTNFRAHQNLVEWFNQIFTAIFPKTDNIKTGAISFSKANAIHPPKGNAYYYHTLFNQTAHEEAQKIITIIQAQQKAHPTDSIAILVRARKHLTKLIPALQRANIPFKASEAICLFDSIVAQDLLSLTYALLHPADRLHWLALLRAPWCGLTLHDLHLIAAKNHQSTIWKRMNESAIQRQLSQIGRQNLTKIIKVLKPALHNRQRLPLRDWIETIWLNINGPAYLTQEYELEQAEQFFHYIEQYDQGGYLDRQLLEQQLKLTYTDIGEQDARLQLMTIHKAKGLEFDCVILPGLQYRSAYDANSLLMWLECPHTKTNDLLLAPIKSSKQKEDSIYRYLRILNQQKIDHESVRLLYVAITRAKQYCHLIANVNFENNKYKAPVLGSLLHLLWPHWPTKNLDLSLVV